MEKRAFKNIRGISLLGFGCMRFPTKDGKIDREKAFEMIDTAYRGGVNYYDTAWIYHEKESELFIGEALKKYPRETFNLATKLPIWLVKSPEDVDRFFEKQLNKCQVEYFDFYLVHCFDKKNFEIFEKNNVYAILKQKKLEGKIRNLGFSFHDHNSVLEKIASKYEWDFGQIQLNYLDYELNDAKPQYEVLKNYGIPTVIMEPVRGGLLASPGEAAEKVLKEANPEKSFASWAIRFAASFENVFTVLSGMTTIEQVEDNLNTMNRFIPINDKERDVLSRALSAYRNEVVIPCTACRYCIGCTSRIDIPAVFTIYNDYRINRSRGKFLSQYEKINTAFRADKCSSCGQCMEKCPQKINIPEKMSEINAEFEKLSEQ